MPGGSLVRSRVSAAEHEMTTRAATVKIIHNGFIRRDFEVRGIARIHGDLGAEYYEMVARPNGSSWNTVPEPSF